MVIFVWLEHISNVQIIKACCILNRCFALLNCLCSGPFISAHNGIWYVFADRFVCWLSWAFLDFVGVSGYMHAFLGNALKIRYYCLLTNNNFVVGTQFLIQLRAQSIEQIRYHVKQRHYSMLKLSIKTILQHFE